MKSQMQSLTIVTSDNRRESLDAYLRGVGVNMKNVVAVRVNPGSVMVYPNR